MNMDNNQNNHIKRQYAIDERRRKVASLLAQSKTETEIAEELGIYQSMVARDVKALREMSQQFVFDLAKSDLAYYYKQCIDGVEEVNRKAWEMFNNYEDNYSDLSAKDRLLALKIIIDANQAKFGLFERGPNIMNIKALEDRLGRVEARNTTNNIGTNQQAFQKA